MRVYKSLCYLAESISILKHCILNEEQREEFRGRVRFALNELNEEKINFEIQNKSIAIGEKTDINEFGYDGIDRKIKNLGGLNDENIARD